MPGYRHAEDTMLDAACAVFAEQGFDAARMDTIAARAGTTKPTLYARFGPKEKLFAAAVRREHDMLNERVALAYQGHDGEPFRDRLHRWTAVYFDFVRERPDGFRLTFEGERHAAAAAAIAEATDERIDSIAALVTRVSGRRPGSGPRVVAAMVVGMLRWCAKEALERPDTDLDAAAALCESMVHQTMVGLDLDLMDAVSKSAQPRRQRASRKQ
ncbi:MAG TPA: helix-turn-helix domain-containing protein [Pseudonocardiaceae bacterium]|jgi:AcrR family transcriptional regulator|nr:helix-turn-helix domain-containing protein [Pseudonocardiaceae bacterium]